MKEKSKGITKCEKRTVTCNKNRTCVMLVLLNIAMELANLRKKIKEPQYVTKKPLNMILELHNVRMESSYVRKK